MAEDGCKGSLSLDTLDVNHLTYATSSGPDWSRPAHSPWYNTLVTINDTAADSGFTATENGLHDFAWDGGGACAIQLPDLTHHHAIVGFHFTAAADGGANLVVTTGKDKDGNDTHFANQTLAFTTAVPPTDLHIMEWVFPHPLQITYGNVQNTLSDDHNTLTIPATATNNQTNIGAKLVFIYTKRGPMPGWQILFQGSVLGTGAINSGGFQGSYVA